MDVLKPSTDIPPKTLILEEQGLNVRLQPLSPKEDCKELYTVSHGPDNEVVWKYLWNGPFPDEKEFLVYLQALADNSDNVPFVVYDTLSQQKVGIVNFMSIVPAMRRIEIGGIWYTPKVQRTHVNTQSCYLLIKYAFEVLKYRRMEWKCDNLNEKSRKAAAGLGFTFEGIFRQHMIIKGRNRDTAWFSITDSEWPHVKAALEDKILARSKQ